MALVRSFPFLFILLVFILLLSITLCLIGLYYVLLVTVIERPLKGWAGLMLPRLSIWDILFFFLFWIAD